MIQFLFFFFRPAVPPRSDGASTVLIASSNTFFSPFCVRDDAYPNKTHPHQRQTSPAQPTSTTHLQILHRPNLLRHLRPLLIRHGDEPPLPQSLERELVITQIELCADEDYWYTGGVVGDFWIPLWRRDGDQYASGL